MRPARLISNVFEIREGNKFPPYFCGDTAKIDAHFAEVSNSDFEMRPIFYNAGQHYQFQFDLTRSCEKFYFLLSSRKISAREP